MHVEQSFQQQLVVATKSPYAPRSAESTTLITMSEAISGLNHPADIIPKSTDVLLETTLSIIWEETLGLL